MKFRFEVLPNFFPLWEQDSRYYILMGGRGAGRSTAASQYGVSRLVQKKYMRGAIMRAVSADIRHSIFQEIMDRIEEQDSINVFHVTENDMRIEYGLNSLQAHGFKASSGSRTAKLKSLANYNVVIIEEAEEIGEAEFRTLDDTLRTKYGDIKIILCLNPPPKSHWIIQRWFDLKESKQKGFYIPKPKEGVVYMFGTYKDNIKNLDEETVRRYRHYRQTNPAYYWNMIRGLVPDVVRGKIFHGWERIDAVPKGAKLLRIGGDWGWYPDPVSTVAIYYSDGYYILKGITFGTEIEDTAVAADILNIDGAAHVRAVFGADEPKSIELMEKKGVKAVKAITGPGSVETRIKLLAEKKVKVVKENHPLYGDWLWNSYETYHWAEDKDGNPKGEPDHEGSDPMDAAMYGIADLTDISKKNGAHVWHPQKSGIRKK